MDTSIVKIIETRKKNPQLKEKDFIDKQIKNLQKTVEASIAILESLQSIDTDGTISKFSFYLKNWTAANAQSLGINLPKGIVWDKDEMKVFMLCLRGCWNYVHLGSCMALLDAIWRILSKEERDDGLLIVDELLAVEPNVFTFEWHDQIDYFEFLHLLLPNGMKFTQDEKNVITICL